MTRRDTVAMLALALTFGTTPPAQAQALLKHTLTAPYAKHYTAKTTYLTVPPRSPLSALVNATLSTWAQTQQQQFVKEARQDFAEGGFNPPYFYSATPFHPCYFAPSLFSVGMVQDEYMGGAHGLTSRTTFNFGFRNGQAKRLGLADFFNPGSDYRKQVQSLLLTKLHHDKRAMFINEMKALSPAQLNRFVVEHDGLRFYFDPYEVGPYAVGPIDVKLTAQELGPDFGSPLTK